MHDAVLCAETGVPAVVIVSEPFQTLARMTAEHLGFPDFPFLVVEHPIFTRDDDWMRATAGRLVDQIVDGRIASIAGPSA